MTSTTTFTYHAIIRRINEAHIFGRFLIQQGVAGFRISTAWPVPLSGIVRHHMRLLHRVEIGVILRLSAIRFLHLRITTVAVGTAQHYCWVGMHGFTVRLSVATSATTAFFLRL